MNDYSQEQDHDHDVAGVNTIGEKTHKTQNNVNTLNSNYEGMVYKFSLL